MITNINPSPLGLNAVYNPMYFIADSDNKAKLNFKYVFDVFCSSAITNSNFAGDIFVDRFRITPDPDNGYGYFSASRILESYVYSYCFPSITGITNSQRSTVNSVIYVGEEYDDSLDPSSASGVTTYSGLSNWFDIRYMNATRQYDEPAEGWAIAYDMNASGKRWLTNWNSSYQKSIYRNEYETISIFHSNGAWNGSSFGQLSGITVQTYNSANTLIGKYFFECSSVSELFPGGDATRQIAFGSGTKNLSISWYNQVSASVDTIMNNGVSTYSIQANDCFDLPSEIITYRINSTCSKFVKKRLAFKNRHGSFDYFTFSMKNRDSVERKNNEWEKRPVYTRYPSPYGSPLSLNLDTTIGDLQRTILNIDGKRKMNLNSDLLQDYEVDFLEKLFFSPEVYLVKDDGTKIPLINTTPNFDVKTRRNDGLFNCNMDFEYGYYMNLQRT